MDEDTVCEVVSVLEGWMIFWTRYMFPTSFHPSAQILWTTCVLMAGLHCGPQSRTKAM